jgi:hypothetical protein
LSVSQSIAQFPLAPFHGVPQDPTQSVYGNFSLAFWSNPLRSDSDSILLFCQAAPPLTHLALFALESCVPWHRPFYIFNCFCLFRRSGGCALSSFWIKWIHRNPVPIYIADPCLVCARARYISDPASLTEEGKRMAATRNLRARDRFRIKCLTNRQSVYLFRGPVGASPLVAVHCQDKGEDPFPTAATLMQGNTGLSSSSGWTTENWNQRKA